MTNATTADWVVICTIAFFVFVRPFLVKYNRETELKERKEALSEERIELWNELVDSYDPMFGDMNNHLKFWIVDKTIDYRNKNWWHYYIIREYKQHFMDLNK